MSKKRKRIEEEGVKTLYFNNLTDDEVERLEDFARSVDMRRKRDAAKEMDERASRIDPDVIYEIGKKFEAAAHKDGAKFVTSAELIKKFEEEEARRGKGVNPDHYKSRLGVECSELMKDRLGEDCYFGFCLCNAFKYLFRCRHKNPTLNEDVRKAHWYLSAAVSLIEKTGSHAE